MLQVDVIVVAAGSLYEGPGQDNVGERVSGLYRMAAKGLGEVFLDPEIVCNFPRGRIGIRTKLQAEVIISEIREGVQTRKLEGSRANVGVIAPEGDAQLILHGGGEIVELRDRTGVGHRRRGLEEYRQSRVEIDTCGIGVDEPAANLVFIADVPVDRHYRVISVVVIR